MFGIRNPTAICFRCRRSYKGIMPMCPTCGNATYRVSEFKPPLRQKVKEWARLEQLVQAGALGGPRHHSRYVTRALLTRAAKQAEMRWGAYPQNYYDRLDAAIDRAIRQIS